MDPEDRTSTGPDGTVPEASTVMDPGIARTGTVQARRAPAPEGGVRKARVRRGLALRDRDKVLGPRGRRCRDRRRSRLL